MKAAGRWLRRFVFALDSRSLQFQLADTIPEIGVPLVLQATKMVFLSRSNELRPSLNASSFQNSLLKALDPEAVQRLHLHPVVFELQHEIEFPGTPIKNLIFVEEGMASMTTTFKDGSQVEVGMFGYESVIGVSALMGSKRSLNRVYTQIAGHGFGCSIEAGVKEFQRGGRFQQLALGYVQGQLLQAMQSAGCNATHDAEQRLARWLLICADRAHENKFKMSHEFLADMLGSSRPTVSIAAAILKQEKLIKYTRGEITILDVPGLEKRACECYRIIKDHLDNYAEFDSGVAA
jgi:CRP-like cAMP-binding protein